MRNREATMRESTGLVENDGSGTCQSLDIVAAFHQYSHFGQSTDTTKESKRHRNDQRTRTRDHQEYQSPVQPHREGIGTEKGRQYRYHCGEQYDDRRIVLGEPCYEPFCLCFPQSGFLDETEDG